VVGRPKHILIISHDVVGTQMAGPGIRYFHLARVLSNEFPVILAIPLGSTLISGDSFSVLSYSSGIDAALEMAIMTAEVVFVPAVAVASFPSLLRTSAAVVVDGYDPYVAETLALGGQVTELQSSLTQAYLMGDFFVCASERQRDWWLGLLEAHGRINAATFGEDATLRKLIAVVPFGLPEEPPYFVQPVIKGVWPGIEVDNKIILWGGGLWPWLDPLTAIRAVSQIVSVRKEVRLVFPGTRHPNPGVALKPTLLQAAFGLAQELGLLDSFVFFGDWIPYADWPAVLLESDLALTLHTDMLEARLAFRSRVLDYIWAGLPIIATRGDATSELIAAYNLGVLVEVGDVARVAEALLYLLDVDRSAWAAGFERARRDLNWQYAAQPLIEFCRMPRRAPDKACGATVGNPFYIAERDRLLAEKEHWQDLAQRYERGKLMRLLRHMQRFKHSLRKEVK